MKTHLSQWPRISVVLGNFNYDCWVERAVQSLLDQNYPNLELLVIDDGSTDRSVELLSKHQSWFDYWNPRDNQGHFSWVKEGSEKATGELINWLCSDDYLAPDSLWKVGKCFRDNPCDLITGEAIRWTGDVAEVLKPRVPERFSKIFSEGILLPQPATFIKTSLFRKALPPVGLVDVLVDTALYLKLWATLDTHITFQIIPETLAHVENHPNAQTAKQGLRTKQEIRRIYQWLESECPGEIGKLAHKRKILHAMLDELEAIASTSQMGISELARLLVKYPQVVVERSFWGAVRKKTV